MVIAFAPHASEIGVLQTLPALCRSMKDVAIMLKRIAVSLTQLSACSRYSDPLRANMSYVLPRQILVRPDTALRHPRLFKFMR